MRNQPKYSIFKNTSYAIAGLRDIAKTETSFKVELCLCVVLVPFIVFVDFGTMWKCLMLLTLMGVLIAETINSAIERVVDLVTIEHHEMAKRAKDAGSTVVFLSIITFLVVWGFAMRYRFWH